MNIIKRISLSVIIVFTTSISHAQVIATKKIDLYILIGQSNMAGRGKVTPELKAEHNDHVYMFTKDQQWVIATHPLHFDKPTIVGVGPGLTFGLAMHEVKPQAEIGLVPCAVGGTTIEQWLPGAYDKTTDTHPYDDAVVRIKAAMQYGTVKGVIWHQGEGNSNPGQEKKYLAQLAELIGRVRTLVGNPNLPFIAGELGRYHTSFANFNMELAKLPAMVPFTAVASSEGFTDIGDNTHFDSRSAEEFGRRFAAKMLEVQKMQKNDGNHQ